ncbi:MAG TPA: GGDEF domain-containing protein, partial [Bryobacteraceae bacterium]|nr:GGDEF domain-containing protein [Bryobacteraceae bacterium]
MREAIASTPLPVPGAAISLSASFGCTSVVRAGNYNPDWLVRVADEALYKAKHSGRNRVVFLDPRADTSPDYAAQVLQGLVQ